MRFTYLSSTGNLVAGGNEAAPETATTAAGLGHQRASRR